MCLAGPSMKTTETVASGSCVARPRRWHYRAAWPPPPPNANWWRVLSSACSFTRIVLASCTGKRKRRRKQMWKFERDKRTVLKALERWLEKWAHHHLPWCFRHSEVFSHPLYLGAFVYMDSTNIVVIPFIREFQDIILSILNIQILLKDQTWLIWQM